MSALRCSTASIHLMPTLGMPWSARVARARDAFFAACAGNAVCGGANIDLVGLYQIALVRLGQATPNISLPAALHLPGDDVRLTSSLFEEVVGRVPAHYPTFYPALTARYSSDSMTATSHRLAEALTALLAGAKQNGNEGAFAAVERRDLPRFREKTTDDASALDLALLPPGVCADWSALATSARKSPSHTDVPTLVLQGEFDPDIRPDDSRRVVDRLGSNARRIDFVGIGHSVRHYSPCAEAVVASFIGLPDRMPDTLCASVRPRRSRIAPSVVRKRPKTTPGRSCEPTEG